MKLYHHNRFIHRGFQLNSLCVAKNKKQALLTFDVSMYYMNNWVSETNVKGHFENLVSGKIYYQFDQYGGEIRYFLSKEDLVKLYELEEIETIISNHRSKFPTYNHTVNHFTTPPPIGNLG